MNSQPKQPSHIRNHSHEQFDDLWQMFRELRDKYSDLQVECWDLRNKLQEVQNDTNARA